MGAGWRVLPPPDDDGLAGEQADGEAEEQEIHESERGGEEEDDPAVEPGGPGRSQGDQVAPEDTGPARRVLWLRPGDGDAAVVACVPRFRSIRRGVSREGDVGASECFMSRSDPQRPWAPHARIVGGTARCLKGPVLRPANGAVHVSTPQVPYLMGAAFGLGGVRVFVDAERNLAIVLLEKVDQSYDILVTIPIAAASYMP